MLQEQVRRRRGGVRARAGARSATILTRWTMRVYSRMQHCAWDGLADRFAAIAPGARARARRGRSGTPRAVPAAGDAAAAAGVAARRAGDVGAAARHAAPRSAPRPRPRPRRTDACASASYRPISATHRDRAPPGRLLRAARSVADRHVRLQPAARRGREPDRPAYRACVRAFCRRQRADDRRRSPSASATIGIAVLVDLNGYTTHARSEIFVHRAAPVQVSWLGYLGTLGAPWYDYVITDRFATPEDQQGFFTERFLYHAALPTARATGKREVAREAPSRAACGLPPAGFVFCCFNTPYKILPPVFDVWMRLLARVPGKRAVAVARLSGGLRQPAPRSRRARHRSAAAGHRAARLASASISPATRMPICLSTPRRTMPERRRTTPCSWACRC